MTSDRDKWIGRKLRDKLTKEVGMVIGTDDFGGHNQRIEVDFEYVRSSVMVPGFQDHYLIDYEIAEEASNV